VHVDLHFILEVLKTSKDAETVSNLDILFEQPCSEVILSISRLSSCVVEVVKPKHAGHDSSTIIKAEEMLVVLLDVEHDGARDRYFSEQVLIPQNKEDLAALLVLLPHHIVIHNCQVFLLTHLCILHGDIVILVLHLLEVLIRPIPERKDIPVNLDYEKGKVDVCEVEIDKLELALLLLLL